MNWNTLEVYIRENQFILTWIAMGAVGLCLLWILVQVSLTRHEVHKICKKIRKYFDVVLTEADTQVDKASAEELELHTAPVYESTVEDEKEQLEQLKKQRDADLLMEVISEVF